MNNMETYINSFSRETVGYMPDELVDLKKLYDIDISGDFLEFLEVAGKCSGGLINSQIVFYMDHGIREFLTMQLDLIDTIQDCKEWWMVSKKPFLLEIQEESVYYFILTKEENGRIYYFEEDSEKAVCTKLSFLDYIKLTIEDNLKLNNVDVCKGDLLSI